MSKLSYIVGESATPSGFNKQNSDVNKDEKKKPSIWEKSIKVGDFTKRLTVKAIENGYLATVSRYGKDPDSQEDKWIDESKDMYCKTNPFLDEEEEEKNEDPDAEAKENAKSTIGAFGKGIFNDI